MSRPSQVTTHHDSAGDYEVEIFDVPKPRYAIVCSHGNGVRRWDGEHFFHNVAEHLSQDAVLLVDQNQPDGDGCRLNPLPVLVSRVQSLITEAAKRYPGTPIIVLGHSMGCAVASFLDLADVKAIVFEAPGAGDQQASLVERYGPDIARGKAVTTSDGLRKVIPAEYYESIKGLNWEHEYTKLLQRFQPVYCFEAGEEEIVGEARFGHRDLPFAGYEIIPHAQHNLAGAPLQDFLTRLDKILASL